MKALAAVIATLGVFAVNLAGAAPVSFAAPGPSDAPQYWFDQWHTEDLWAAGARGQGVVIAEIDTGVNANLPELEGKILPGEDFGEPGGDGRVDREIDEFGHGTAMASIMVADKGLLGITGMAPEAKILPIAVPLSGTTDAGREDHVDDAIRWAADRGAKIITMSLGGERNSEQHAVACPQNEQDAIEYALGKGAILFAAAGNRGATDNAVEAPAVCLGVIAVGAVDQGGRVASFSSRHPYLAMAAPGVRIASLSRLPGSAYQGDGTSQATAIASAAAALVWSKFPKLSGRQIAGRLFATLDGKTDTRSSEYGYGRLNLYAAATEEVPSGAPDLAYEQVEPFLQRDAAIAAQRKAATPPAAASTPGQSTGQFRIGHAERIFTSRMLTGVLIAAAGLIALVALIVLGRRRHRAATASAVPFVAAAPEVDESGTVWHEIQPPRS